MKDFQALGKATSPLEKTFQNIQLLNLVSFGAIFAFLRSKNPDTDSGTSVVEPELFITVPVPIPVLTFEKL
jgi:hypothetical protein